MLGRTVISNLAQFGVAAWAAWTCWRVRDRGSRAARRAWTCFAWGVLSWSLAQALFTASDLWFGGHDGVPAFATAPQSGDPKFVIAGSDYHLGTGSAAAGTGSAAVSSLVKVDLDGSARSSLWDIGAYAASAAH